MRHFGIFSNNMSQWLKIMQIPFMSQKKLEIVHKILLGKSCVKKPYHPDRAVFFIRIWGVVRKEGETQKKASLNFFSSGLHHNKRNRVDYPRLHFNFLKKCVKRIGSQL